MNKFKEQIESHKHQIDTCEREMEAFSKRLQNIIGLTPEACDGEKWDVGNYVVSSRNFCHDGWKNLFYAVPCSTSEDANVGWSNVSVGKIPSGWVYIPKGTGTIIYPKDEQLQQIILDQCKKFAMEQNNEAP